MARVTLSRLVVQMEAENAKLLKKLDESNKAIVRFTGNADGALKRFGSIAKAGIAGIAAAFTVDKILDSVTGILKVTASYETLNKSLETVTGSQVAANRVFEELRQFTTETPFQLQEITQSYIKLKALGLDPTIDTLRSFGNTASALGKSFDQFAEAVADAVTGEFERLRDFGIKASKQGDQVAFTFRDVTKTIRFASQDIRQYLLDIGNVEFAGSMDRQTDTLNVAFSNLKDSVKGLADYVGRESGLAAFFKEAAVNLTELINAAIPGKARISELREELEKLYALRDSPSRLTSRGRRGGVATEEAVRSAEQEVLEAIEAAGGEAGLRAAIDRLENQRDTVLTRLESADKRTAQRLRNNLSALNAEIDQAYTDLAEIVLDFNDAEAGPVKSAPSPAVAKKAKSRASESAKTAVDYAFDLIDAEFADLEEQAGRGLAGLNTKAIEDDLQRTAAIFDETRTPLERLNIELAELDRLFEAGAFDQFADPLDVYARAVFDASEATDDLNEKIQDTSEVAADLGLTFASAFEDAIVSGAKLRDVLQGLAQDVLRIFARKTITEPLAASLTGFIGGAFPGFATGTSFAPGGPAIVGEHGPEAVYLPHGSRVVPNDQLGGSMTINVDARGSTDPSATENAVRRAVNEAVATMRDMRRRNMLPEFA